jgi:hypothetical protein
MEWIYRGEKMKHISVLAIIALLVTGGFSLALAQEQRDFRTWDTFVGPSQDEWAFNGSGWLSMDTYSRAAYALGMVDGTLMLLMQVKSENTGSLGSTVSRERSKLTAYDLVDEIIPLINDFYADSGNIKVPVIEAYRYALKKLQGNSNDRLRNDAAQLKQRYAAR